MAPGITYPAGDAPGSVSGGLASPANSGQPSNLPPPVDIAPARWEWLLCDGAGNALAELTTASAKQLTFQRNNYVEAQFAISHEDDAAVPFLNAVANGPLPTLRCYRKGADDTSAILRFNGYMAPFSETLEETAILTPVFRSPFGRLYGDGWSGSGRYTGPTITATNQNADSIAAALINLYGGAGTLGATDPVFGIPYAEASFAGLAIGNIASTIQQTISYNYANVGQSIIFLSQVLNGFDFDETFVERGTTMALFNTYGSAGQDRPNAIFQYGPKTISNVRNVERTTAPPQNYVRLIGSDGLISVAENAASEAQFGKWATQQQVTGVPTQSALDLRAKALLRGQPVKTLVIQPDIALPSCPRPFDDFNLGDTVHFYGLRGAFSESLAVRVNQLQIVIDENGIETATVPDPHTLSREDRENRTDLLHTSFTVESSSGL